MANPPNSKTSRTFTKEEKEAVANGGGNGGTPVDTTYENIAFAASVPITHSETRPFKKITQTGNMEVILSGLGEGKNAILKVTRTGNFTVTLNGRPIPLPTYDVDDVNTSRLYFTAQGEEAGALQWFYNPAIPGMALENPEEPPASGSEIPLATVIEVLGFANDGNGMFGYEFTMGGAAKQAVKLGRYMHEAYNTTFTVRIYKASDFSIVASAVVDATGVAPGQTAWGSITPVTLAANTTYLVMASSLSNNDTKQWLMWGVMAASPYATVNRGAKAVTGSGYNETTGAITGIDDYYPGAQNRALGTGNVMIIS